LTEISNEILWIICMLDTFYFEHFKVLFWAKYQHRTVLKIRSCQDFFAYLKVICSVFLHENLCTSSYWYVFYEYKGLNWTAEGILVIFKKICLRNLSDQIIILSLRLWWIIFMLKTFLFEIILMHFWDYLTKKFQIKFRKS
jgi:hypothetical protein